MNNKGIIIFGGILTIGLIIMAGMISHVFYRVKSLDNTISVTGSSEKIIRSDTAKWRANFSRSINVYQLSLTPVPLPLPTPKIVIKNADEKKGSSVSAVGVDISTINSKNSAFEMQLKDANDQLKRDLMEVEKYLDQNGISKEHISINPVVVIPIYEQGTYGPSGKIIGYTLTQQIVIEDSDIEKITKAAQNSNSLLNQGIIFASDPIEYYYSKLNELKLDMLAEATENAKNRAEKIAKSSGSNVSNLRSASMGVFQITSVNSTDISDYGAYDVSSIDKKVMAVVKASFLLK